MYLWSRCHQAPWSPPQPCKADQVPARTSLRVRTSSLCPQGLQMRLRLRKRLHAVRASPALSGDCVCARNSWWNRLPGLRLPVWRTHLGLRVLWGVCAAARPRRGLGVPGANGGGVRLAGRHWAGVTQAGGDHPRVFSAHRLLIVFKFFFLFRDRKSFGPFVPAGVAGEGRGPPWRPRCGGSRVFGSGFWV